MKHLGGAVLGLVGALLAWLVTGVGFAQAFRALQLFDLGAVRTAGALLLLLGGALLGAAAATGLLSAAGPLTGALVLLAASLVELAAPGVLLTANGPLDDPATGMGLLLQSQLTLVPAGLLLVAAVVVRRRPAAPAPAFPAHGYAPPR